LSRLYLIFLFPAHIFFKCPYKRTILFGKKEKEIAAKAKLKLSDTEKMVNAFTETVSGELKNKGKVTLVGFGTFAVAHRKQRTGVDPRTGKKITIPTKDVPVFRPGHGPREIVK
jgi:DNA-binding protein HU-beta